MPDLPVEFRPVGVDRYRSIVGRLVQRHAEVPKAHALCSNISYSLQYIEFLSAYYRRYDHHYTIGTLLIKDYVIVGCGILEAIFHYIIRTKGWSAKSELETIRVMKGNPFEHNGEKLVIHNHLLRQRQAAVFEEMTFDQMAKKVESKHIFRDENIYPKLSKLRKLRNTVHLQTAVDYISTDFNSFERAHFWEMSTVLWLVLTSELFSPTSEQVATIEFLKPPEEA